MAPLLFFALGTAPGGPRYEIRVTCAIIESGRIEAAIECFDATAVEFQRRGQKTRTRSQKSGVRSQNEAAPWTALFEQQPAASSQKSETPTSDLRPLISDL